MDVSLKQIADCGAAPGQRGALVHNSPRCYWPLRISNEASVQSLHMKSQMIIVNDTLHVWFVFNPFVQCEILLAPDFFV